jgi:ferrous iron transport protein B
VALRADRDPRTLAPVYTGATVAALLVFFVFALQCLSTIAVMRRETNSWRWPAFAFGYLLSLAWVASFLTHRVALALGAGA